MFPAFLLPLLLIDTRQVSYTPPKYNPYVFRLELRDNILQNNLYFAKIYEKHKII